jgi:hypothetical protein
MRKFSKYSSRDMGAAREGVVERLITAVLKSHAGCSARGFESNRPATTHTILSGWGLLLDGPHEATPLYRFAVAISSLVFQWMRCGIPVSAILYGSSLTKQLWAICPIRPDGARSSHRDISTTPKLSHSKFQPQTLKLKLQQYPELPLRQRAG